MNVNRYANNITYEIRTVYMMLPNKKRVQKQPYFIEVGMFFLSETGEEIRGN